MFGSIKSDKSQNQSMEFQLKESMKSVPPKEQVGFSMFQSKNSEQNSVKSGKSIKKEEAEGNFSDFFGKNPNSGIQSSKGPE